jgi:multidrug efflux pump subunit AcrA (membrane-fusion protein)
VADSWPGGSNPKPPPSNRCGGGEVQRVSAADVTIGAVHQTFSGIGTVTPLATITVQTQINDQLQEIGLNEGQLAEEGDFLAQIDPRPYQAALDKAEGSLAHDQGLLDQAQSDLKRYETLGRQDSIALQQVADQKFLVTQDKGTVAVDKANIETAKAQSGVLSYRGPGHRPRRAQACRSRQLSSDNQHHRHRRHQRHHSIAADLGDLHVARGSDPGGEGGKDATVEAYDRANLEASQRVSSTVSTTRSTPRQAR